MSNYVAEYLHPTRYTFQKASCIDDYFGNHRYGIIFKIDPTKVYSSIEFTKIERDTPLSLEGFIINGEEYGRYLRHHKKYNHFSWWERPTFKLSKANDKWFKKQPASIRDDNLRQVG